MKYYKWILLLAMLTGVVIIPFLVLPEEESVIDQIQKIEIEELKRENIVLKENNDLLDQEIVAMELITDSLIALVIKDQQVIDKLIVRKNEKVSAIDDFTDDELYRYFARFSTKGTTDRE
jgi:aspartate carbamoyltransferase regulatory subunit